ncbi:GAF domain-containing protein [Microcoleus sp. FACHB-SPT15]|uniref:GAF domain-containing sensor histidine kinase n=1 Tax=Microcoleus sp. FACHB-SPT15 TaxID=2692830 RepID=UPI001782A037|nr:ATP-binding protein [Microcoleus sp. FACHB-SPT15]MBD1804506.1 GAF domain-containing protein [Microcoleus sp. FACHB-SPT15]
MSLDTFRWQQEQHALEVLSSLSYRTDELKDYLQAVARGVSELIGLDWSVVTLCQDGQERILSSTLDLGEAVDRAYNLHGTLTGTVIATGAPLVVEDAKACTDYGQAPDGYRAYLGVPLRTSIGEVIGTICSFQRQPRCFTDQEVRIAEIFAERAAMAIDNYQLYQQQRQFNQILEAEVAQRTKELQMAQAQLIEANEQLEAQVEQRTAELRQTNEQLQAEMNERKQAEQEIARLAEIGELAAMIVHEVRNPLTTVLMGLSALGRIELPEHAQLRLVLALEEADRLKRLLDEILLYAKRQVLECQALEVNDFVTGMLDSIRTLPAAKGRRIEFVSMLPSAWIFGDCDKLKQVFINLIENACEAVADDEVITWRTDFGISPDRVCISIHNAGNPIPTDILSQLGTPFFTTKPCGNGLGLAIVKRIVKAHAGELIIQSEVGIGTIVSVQLPRLGN